MTQKTSGWKNTSARNYRSYRRKGGVAGCSAPAALFLGFACVNGDVEKAYV
jgi:hypothetical protein